MRIVNTFFVLITLYIFSGCANKVGLPKMDKGISSYVKILEPIDGYYENKIGKDKKIITNDYTYETIYTLLKWPENNFNTICFLNNICLIDTLNNGYFTHSAIRNYEELFPLNKPTKYTLLKRTSKYIENPKIYQDKTLRNGASIIYLPALNSIQTKEVGESIFKKINEFRFNTSTVKINQTVSGFTLNEYGEGKNNFNISFTSNYKLLEWPENNYKTICENNICLVDTNNTGYFTHSAMKEMSQLFPLDKSIKYFESQDVSYNEDSFKYEVLYQGKIANKIKISFREFNNDMVRPAFTQDIEYELESNKPTIIGFKGLRIEVIKATNQNITYSVIKDYN